MSAIATPHDRPRSVRRPALWLMPGFAAGTDAAAGSDAAAGPFERPALRLVDDEAAGRPVEEGASGLAEEGPCILVAGADPRLRAAVRSELAGAMEPGTIFEEAGMVWEVLEQAPRSGVVMLAGDLRDASAAGLTRLLAQRHPRLPIVALDAPESH
jgi:hypothetical protein